MTSYIGSLSCLVKGLEGDQRTQKYRHGLRQDIPRNQRLSPMSWSGASLPEVSPFFGMREGSKVLGWPSLFRFIHKML